MPKEYSVIIAVGLTGINKNRIVVREFVFTQEYSNSIDMTDFYETHRFLGHGVSNISREIAFEKAIESTDILRDWGRTFDSVSPVSSHRCAFFISIYQGLVCVLFQKNKNNTPTLC